MKKIKLFLKFLVAFCGTYLFVIIASFLLSTPMKVSGKNTTTFNNSDLRHVIDSLSAIPTPKPIELDVCMEVFVMIENFEYPLDYYPDVSPINSFDFVELSSKFGWRKHPIYDTPLFHDGIDISAIPNADVFSTISGTVVKVEYSNVGYGNTIDIKNSNGYLIRFAHLTSNILVTMGQKVKKGELVGTVGHSGTLTGPHLHYEIHHDNELKNPLAYYDNYNMNYLAIR